MTRKTTLNDLTGQAFGQLTVLSRAPSASKNVRWLCECSCGNKSVVLGHQLRTGRTKSCGCLKKAFCRLRHRRHGAHGSREHKSWSSMITRCCNPSNPAYRHYGGRGITVCPEWRESFSAFLADMGPRPEGTSLDRIDNNSNYEPSNCRWATQAEQDVNKRNTRVLTIAGETIPVVMAAKRFGVNAKLVRSRLDKGWPPERALVPPREMAEERRATGNSNWWED